MTEKKIEALIDKSVKKAFKEHLPKGTKEVLFGHYHYQIDKEYEGVSYHCIRPVGHHRDKDICASYTILENGILNGS